MLEEKFSDIERQVLVDVVSAALCGSDVFGSGEQLLGILLKLSGSHTIICAHRVAPSLRIPDRHGLVHEDYQGS